MAKPRVSKGRRKKVYFKGGPFDGQIGYLYDLTGTLPIKVNGQRGRYVSKNGNRLAWEY